jgi:hypothetical protein
VFGKERHVEGSVKNFVGDSGAKRDKPGVPIAVSLSHEIARVTEKDCTFTFVDKMAGGVVGIVGQEKVLCSEQP